MVTHVNPRVHRAAELGRDGADVAGCTLALASRQVRLHRVTATAAHLRVASHPVLEHCSGVTCAPPTIVLTRSI